MGADPRQEAARRFTEAMEGLLQHPHEEVRHLTEGLLGGMDQIHREALARITNLLDHHGLMAAAAADPVIAGVLDLYELLPATPADEVERALEGVRPYIQSHGGQLEVLGVDDGVVKVRLAGSCAGCSGSAMTLKRGVEAALREGFAGFAGMQVEEAEAAPARPTFIGLDQIKLITPPVKPVFVDAAALEDVTGMTTVRLGDQEVLLHNVAGEIYAFLRGGDRRDSLPVAIQAGRVMVATNVPALAPAPA